MKNRSQSENLGFYPKHLNIDQRNLKITDNKLENEPPISSDAILSSEFRTKDSSTNHATSDTNNNKILKKISKVNESKKIFNIFRKKHPESEVKSDLDIVKDDTVDEPPRETWSKRLDFLMSIIGFSVDIAGIWRL